ncbi:MAG: ABC transporter permease [Deltaproteobacteria bacterium]|nr:ABC transporter permease [Deltaproteobacteria bacterium]
MMMVDLVRAELLKVRHSPFVRGLLFLSALLPLTLMLIVATAMSNEKEALLRWPLSVDSIDGFFPLVAFVVPPTMLAWLVGVEQTGDTWKLVLARRPTRIGFLIAKVVVVVGVFVIFSPLCIAFWLAAHEALGVVLGQVPSVGAGVVVERAMVTVVGALFGAMILGSLALLYAVLVPKNGTVAGSVGALLTFMTAGIVDSADAPPLVFVRPIFWAGAQVLDAQVPPELATLDPTRACVVLAVWTLAPAAIALAVFARRDVESGAAG